MRGSEDVVVSAIVDALTFLTRYVDEREVPDDVADDDCKALESVASYLQDVPDGERPRLIALVGPRMAYECGLIDEESQG